MVGCPKVVGALFRLKLPGGRKTEMQNSLWPKREPEGKHLKKKGRQGCKKKRTSGTKTGGIDHSYPKGEESPRIEKKP